jgi:hypothetical protein
MEVRSDAVDGLRVMLLREIQLQIITESRAHRAWNGKCMHVLFVTRIDSIPDKQESKNDDDP